MEEAERGGKVPHEARVCHDFDDEARGEDHGEDKGDPCGGALVVGQAKVVVLEGPIGADLDAEHGLDEEGADECDEDVDGQEVEELARERLGLEVLHATHGFTWMQEQQSVLDAADALAAPLEAAVRATLSRNLGDDEARLLLPDGPWTAAAALEQLGKRWQGPTGSIYAHAAHMRARVRKLQDVLFRVERDATRDGDAQVARECAAALLGPLTADGVYRAGDDGAAQAADDDDAMEVEDVRPLVVIDGANVAMSHGRGEAKFSVRGVQLAAEAVAAAGGRPLAFLPAQHVYEGTWAHSSGLVVATPPQAADDDVFFLQHAVHAPEPVRILSNDLFRDHFGGTREWRAWVDAHVMPYAWADGDRLLVEWK